MEILVTRLSRDRDSMVTYYPGETYDMDPNLAQRFKDAGAGEELTKFSLESKTAAEVQEIATAAGVEVTGSEKKAELVNKVSKSK